MCAGVELETGALVVVSWDVSSMSATKALSVFMMKRVKTSNIF